MKSAAHWMRHRRSKRDRSAALLSAILLGACGAVTGAFFGVLLVETAAAMDLLLYDWSVPGTEMAMWLPYGGGGALFGLVPGALIGWRLA